MTTAHKRFLAVAAAVVLGGVIVAARQDAASEEFARRRYESGLEFLRDQKYAEALKDFQAVVESYPSSRVAHAALLQIAQYQLDTAGDPDAAQAAVELLQKKYGTSESGPMALVLTGRIAVSRGRASSDVEAALASFERVPRLFPGSDAVPAALFHAGEVLRLTHRDDDAVEQYRQVWTDHPQSAWAAPAMLGEARCLAGGGRVPRAMELLQRVRQRFPGSPAAATAIAWNTILYRLYVRAPAQPPYQFSGRTITGPAGRIKDVVALTVDARGAVLAALRSSIQPFDSAGKPLPPVSVSEVRAIRFDRAGRLSIFHRGGYVGATGLATAFTVPKPDGSPRALDDVAAGLVTSFGELLVTDKNARNLARFSAAGRHLGTFATVSASRLAIDVTDRVVALDEDGGGVTLVDADGKVRTRLAPKGPGYQFDRPVDTAVDELGHVYVLDRNRASVFVFVPDPQPRLVAGFTVPVKAPGAFRKAVCLAIDRAGRLYIYDDDIEKILVFH